MMAYTHTRHPELNQSFHLINGSADNGLTSAGNVVTTSADLGHDTSLPSADFREWDINVSRWVCGANSTQEWQLVSPVCSTRYHTLALFVVVAITLSLIILWTILGNLFVLLAICRYSSLRTMSNCLIGNLAISDLLLAVTVLPISTVHDLLGYWVFGELTCTLWLCIDVLYCTASIWGLCTVAFDRYLATVYPVWYHDQRSVRKAVGCIVFVWVFSIIISFAPFIGWQDMIPSFFSFNPTIRRYECILFTTSSYVLYSAMGSFVIPGILMTFMYIRIFVVLHSQSKGLKKKVSLTSNSPTYDGNGYPTIHEPSDEEVNGVARDFTTTTLISVTAESSTNLDEAEETDAKVETDRLLVLNHGNHTLGNDRNPNDTSNGLKPLVAKTRSSPNPPSARSNSFAIPTDATRGKISSKNLLSVVDLERRNSHNVTLSMQRSTSDMGSINANMLELRLTTAAHRSKSANMLNSNDADSFRPTTIPRRSLPCNMSAVFPRNNRLTMSMKRRFELREQRATKRMLLIMACFCVCWVPFLFMYILRSVCDTCEMNYHFVAAIIWLGYVNSSLNPVLYTLFNDDFKSAFKKLVGLKSKRVRQRQRRKR